MKEYRRNVEICVKKRDILLDNCIILTKFVAYYYLK